MGIWNLSSSFRNRNMSTEREQNNFAPVPKTPAALEKAEPGARRVLSGMTAEILALAKKGGPLRIVVVDDEKILLDIYKIILQPHFKDAAILSFLDGEEAWREISLAPPDVLITDMARPGLNGWKMLPLLAAQECKFPIVVLSGSADEKDVRKCAGDKLNISYLAKPYQISLLIGLLESILKGCEAVPPESALTIRRTPPKTHPATILFSAEHIIPDLKARERFAAIREIVAHLINIGRIKQRDEKAMLDSIFKRENSMSTGLGFGIAIPRGRVDCVRDIILAIGVSSSGVEFDALDEQPVYVSVLSISPHSQSHEVILQRITESLGRFLQIGDGVGQLHRCNSSDQMWSILRPVVYGESAVSSECNGF